MAEKNLELSNESGKAFEGGSGHTLTKDGIAVIIPNFSKLDIWDIIEELISDYTKLHPQEVRDILDGNKEERAARRTATGASEQGSLRFALSLPVGLHFLLKKHIPEFSSTDPKQRLKFVRKFMLRFPGFRIPDKI